MRKIASNVHFCGEICQRTL